jgi:hypothetical protein
VIAAGPLGEGGGDGDHARPSQGEDPVELGEAEVVTDGQPDHDASGLAEGDLIARLLDRRLAVFDVADLHVEHVDLAVDRALLPVGTEQHGCVGELVVIGDDLGDAARHQVDAEFAGPAGCGAQGGAVERLRRGADRLGRAQHRPLLGQNDQLRALGGGPSNKALGNLEVAVVFVSGVELYGGGAQFFSPTKTRIS